MLRLLVVRAVLALLCLTSLLSSVNGRVSNRTAALASNRTRLDSSVNDASAARYHIGKWIQTPWALTRHRPAAMVQQFYNSAQYMKCMKVCWNSYTYDSPNTIRCADWDANGGRTDQVWYEFPQSYVLSGAHCGGGMELVGGVALAGTDGSQKNNERGFYMYGRSNTNRVVRFLWEDADVYLSAPQCINNFIWEFSPCYNSEPAALYVDKGLPNSFVLILSQNQDGYMFMTTEQRSFGIGSQQLVTDVNSQQIRMSASATMMQDGHDVLVWYTGYGPTNPPQVFITIFHTNTGQWDVPRQVASVDQPYVGASYDWLVRVARDIDPHQANVNIMMWTKDSDALVADLSDDYYTDQWHDYDENDDEPASSCSELIRYNNVYYNELWVLCFYRGRNDNRIWYTGFTFPY